MKFSTSTQYLVAAGLLLNSENSASALSAEVSRRSAIGWVAGAGAG
eukprot:CAMPEP_0176133384 /NCGR_PEP_ID=MMETSP0120_2-20121206/67606_1 /TAXON_ID=160619 /ORGANISM="Kryptoperidinium foliaceum, Strain CCMP 1326" /LENGTH=45 /DNA_ID= /DNA_START= /DNA_END= /DNA_ORIENTATION=